MPKTILVSLLAAGLLLSMVGCSRESTHASRTRVYATDFKGSRSAGRRQRASRPPVRRTLVSASVDVITPQVEVAPNGEAVAAWARGIRDIVPAARGAEIHPAGPGGTIEVATGRVGTGFSRPQVLARLKTAGNSPVLAEDGEGDAVVAWTDDSRQLVYSIRPRGGSFGPSRVLASSGSLSSVGGGRGHLFVAAWTSSESGRGAKINVATGNAVRGFGAPLTLPAREPDGLTLDVNARGSVLVVDDESAGRARVWLRSAGRPFQLAGKLTQGNGGVSAALRPDDSIVALINGSDTDLPGVSATFRPPTGKFSRPTILARDGEFAVLGADGRGKVTAIWTLYTAQSSPTGVTYATAARGRPFGKPRRKRRRGGHSGALAVSDSGRRLILWEQNMPGGQTSYLRFAKFARAGDRLSKLHTVVHKAVSEYALGVADDGRGLVVWTGDDGHGNERGVFYAKIG